jgi:hypothetical protein
MAVCVQPEMVQFLIRAGAREVCANTATYALLSTHALCSLIPRMCATNLVFERQ